MDKPKGMKQKSKEMLRKDATAISSVWNDAAVWLGQYSKILESLRPVASVR